MLVLFAASLSVREGKAVEKGAFYYCPKGGQGQYCQCIDDAFMACYKKGGVIQIYEDVKLDFPDSVKYGCLTKDTALLIGGDATVTIGRNGFRMDGSTQVLGTIDMEHSDGILYGDGELSFPGGKIIKRSYTIDQKGEKICLEGTDLTYGQALADSVISPDRIKWRASVEGNWQFREPEQKPQAGTGNHDVVFRPKYPMTYEQKEFDQCGKVTTRQAVPVMHTYETLKLQIGEMLQKSKPDIHFVSPVNGEEVSGFFSFDQPEQILLTVGEQKIRGRFTPHDGNYTVAEEYIKVYVQTTVPEVTKAPLVRNQGIYGQTLEQIRFVPGKCVNPYNDNEVTGTWEWQDTTERLTLGTKTYRMLFLPDIQGYEAKEIPVEVTVRPKVMEDIEWPACTDLIYGQRLSESELSFVKNEYGTFSWQNENVRPGVNNPGAAVIFRPANTDVYDWSRLSGYDEKSHTISFVIPVRVCPLKGELPVIQAAEIEEGSSVSGSALRIRGTAGQAVWQRPEQSVQQSGWYSAYFIPEDADNYDWSSYAPDEQGKISIDVYVKMRKKAGTNPVSEDMPTSKPTAMPDDTVKDEQIRKGSSSLGDTATFVITQMVSRISKIRIPSVTVKKTEWVERKRKNSRMFLRWKKVKGVHYQIQYRSGKKWKHSRKKTVRGTFTTIRGLKRKQKYYVRIRCVKTKKGKNYYSQWTKKKRI